MALALLMVVSEAITIAQPMLVQHTYAMGTAESLLPKTDSALASKLQYDATKGLYNFNAGYTVANAMTDADSGGPEITASFNSDLSKGIMVTDPINKVDFTMKPQFGTLAARQDGNRLLYPLADGTGWVVYTMQVSSVKEDVVLDHANGNTMKLSYDMDIDSQGLAARKLTDGSVGVYGSSLPITGNVSTGNAKDAALLQKARDHSKKDKLIFSMPAPTVYSPDKKVSKTVHTSYSIKGAIVTAVTEGLKASGTNFPLDVDPAVTVLSATNPFRDTNPDSNIDLTSSTGNISRGDVTGGVVTTNWSTNATSLASSRFLAGYAVYNDYAYVAGGAVQGTTTNLTTVEYAPMNQNNASIGTWATTTPLPVGLSKFHLVAYNGYLYAIGGATGTTTCATNSNKIYYNRMQTNGQLSSTWIDSSTTSGTTLLAAGCGMAATISNNHIYVYGGKTSNAAYSSSNMISGFLYASIKPDGSIGSFTNIATNDTSADSDIVVYSGYIYFVGGIYSTSGAGAIANTVFYYPLDANGVPYGAGEQTNTLNTPRINLGANFLAANDGYAYVQGGCGAVNTNSACTSTLSDIEVAQINADGTFGTWATLSTSVASLPQVGGGLLFWRGSIYVLGGCTTMSTTAVQCTTTVTAPRYDTIATAGQISGVSTSPTDTPALTTTVWGHGMAIVNGYLFVIGGCVAASCQTSVAASLTASVQVAKLNADGSTGAFTTTTSIPVAESAMAVAVYNNYIYLVGGYIYTGTSNGSASNRIFYGQVSATGTIASWATLGSGTTATYTTAALARYYSSAVAYKGYLYIFGGCVATANATGCSTYYKDVYSSPIGANGVLANTWATQTQLPNNVAGQNTCTAVALMAATVYGGRVYLAGGACNTTYGQSNRIQYATLTNGTVGTMNAATGNMTTDGTTPLPIRRGDAFATNGYLYVMGGHNGVDSSTHGEIQIGKINLTTGNIDANLTPSITKMTARWDTRAAFSNGTIYVTGGCTGGTPANTCTSPSNLVQYFQIYNAGNQGTSTWTGQTATYTPAALYAPAATAYNGYLYVAGGCTAYNVAGGSCSGGTVLGTVSYAPLNPDGTIGTWSSGGTLPTATYGACMVGVGSSLFVIGGLSTSNATLPSVSYTTIGSGGTPAGWTAGTALTAAAQYPGCAAFNGHLYVTGGGNSAVTNTVYYSANDVSAGANVTSWSTGASMQTVRYGHQTVVAGGYLYALGGYDGTNYLQTVEYVQLLPAGGTSGSWAYTNDLPTATRDGTAFAANGYIYLSGGRSASAACTNNTYIASVNSSGQVGSWSQGVNKFTTARYGAGGGYYNGHYYMMGGYDCTGAATIASSNANAIVSGGEQSQAMEATFSKYADLNGDGTPQKLVIYLTNAQLNGVDIEKWKMMYVSSREADNSWGATTTVSPLVGQNAYSVNAYNASGTNQLLARWFYLSFSIDMTTSFTFTDDTQPYISQYGLHYSPPTSKRLLHGRDFRDQTQQGEDLKLGS